MREIAIAESHDTLLALQRSTARLHQRDAIGRASMLPSRLQRTPRHLTDGASTVVCVC